MFRDLDEEDLALCAFLLCAGKHEYTTILRDVLTKIKQEG
jgi:Na+-transporting NADH:ubiquinone oxidoreductase subunit NqrA